MRCSGWSSLATWGCRGEARLVLVVAVGCALLLPGRAGAHVAATPTFVASEGSSSIAFAGPNERAAPMTGFSITVPSGLRIEHAHEVEGWTESIEGSTATWSGSSLGPEAVTAFGATIGADTEPGVVDVIARQLYADGNDVRWTVPITIAPPEKTPAQNLALAGVVAFIGVLLVVAIAMLAWRRGSTRSA